MAWNERIDRLKGMTLLKPEATDTRIFIVKFDEAVNIEKVFYGITGTTDVDFNIGYTDDVSTGTIINLFSSNPKATVDEKEATPDVSSVPAGNSIVYSASAITGTPDSIFVQIKHR